MGGHSDTLRNIVAETTAEINHYESLLRPLLAKRASAQLELDSLIYPVLTLPPEITSQIFWFSLPTSYTDCIRNTGDPYAAPMVLAHVCGTWRQIAFSTPALWTTIDHEPQDSQSAHIFEAWLDRARAFPLSIRLAASELEDDATTVISQTLAARSRTMQSLELDMSVDQLQIMQGAADPWSFPLLQVLSISVSDGDSLVDDPFIETFSTSPLLREVSLIMPSPTTPSLFHLPWHQLTKFTGTLPLLADFMDVLRQSPNLAECTFAQIRTNFMGFTVLTHTNLKFLSLLKSEDGYGRASTPADILEYISLPALQTLHIAESETEESNYGHFHRFLLRSSPPLRKFTIRMEHHWNNFDVAWFFKMPHLVEFEIWNPAATTSRLGSFFGIFFHAFCDTSFLPQLQHLAFLECESARSIVLQDMLKSSLPGLASRSRAQPRTEFAQLKSFHLAWADNSSCDFQNLPEELLLSFRELVAQGMDIRIQGELISCI